MDWLRANFEKYVSFVKSIHSMHVEVVRDMQRLRRDPLVSGRRKLKLMCLQEPLLYPSQPTFELRRTQGTMHGQMHASTSAALSSYLFGLEWAG
eukprot:1357079-Alexandrium_andersonii.AAC.1